MSQLKSPQTDKPVIETKVLGGGLPTGAVGTFFIADLQKTAGSDVETDECWGMPRLRTNRCYAFPNPEGWVYPAKSRGGEWVDT